MKPRIWKLSVVDLKVKVHLITIYLSHRLFEAIVQYKDLRSITLAS
jgi:hypothetical protein